MAKKLHDYTKEELLELVQSLKKVKKFGLVWEDKPEQVAIDCQTRLPVLQEVTDRAITKADDQPTNLIIEGDNYHSLSTLNYTHAGKINVIYIDPPYNTGHKDFVYNDHFVDKEDGFRHSKWLSFMAKRIKLAKDLLAPNGFIFISIDDNEQTNLKLLCDEVFGDNNFIGQFIHKNNSSKNQANLLSISTEYMLCYAKNMEALKGLKWRIPKKGAKDIVKTFNKLKASGLSIEEIALEIKDMYSRPKYAHLSRWNKVDELGVFKDADLSREGGKKDYTIVNPNTGKEVVIPSRGWGKSHEELLRLQKEDMIWYGDENTPPGLKDYIESDRDSVPDNFLYFDNSVDTRMIKAMFGSLVFENPKPLEMIKMIINIASNKESTVLDFFAGSGTTGHAVIDLNKDDGGSRKFILCTNNENDIAENVTYQRVNKVIDGYSDVAGIPANVRYFKTDFVDKADNTDQTRVALVARATDMIKIRENTFETVIEKPLYKVYASVDTYSAIIFEPSVIGEAKAELAKLPLDKPIFAYVFSLANDSFDSDFADMDHTMHLCPIPESILEVYKRIFTEGGKK